MNGALWFAPAAKSPSASACSFPHPRAKLFSKPKSSSVANSEIAYCVSSLSTTSSPSSTASATCRFPPTFTATMQPPTASATRLSSRANEAPSPHPPQACTSRRRCSNTLTVKGVEIARVTLHVGLGTFAPLRVERVDEVHLHRERYSLSESAADALNRAVRKGRRIVAVGTTVVRTLESCAARAELRPNSGRTPAKRRSSSLPAIPSAL